MLKAMKMIGLILLFAAAAAAQDLYDIGTITAIDLTFPEADWDQILDDLRRQGQEERHLGAVSINGVFYDSVGVRYKGNSSYNERNRKNPLNIKLDYIIDQEHQGYGTIKLANAYKDPTFVREVMSYEMARSIMPASRANWAWVTINGEDIGLYTSVQDVDKAFADEHYGSRNNAFFKGELMHGPGTMPSQSVWAYLGDNAANYMANYELESDEGWDRLINFLDVFNNDSGNMDQALNVDRHLWMLAFDNLMVNLDAPINFGHNFYLYEDDYGRINPIIWDLNENFGVFTGLLNPNGPQQQLSSTELQNLSPFLNASASDYPIVQKVLSIPRYQRWYIAHMKALIAEYFSSGWYLERAEELQAIVDDAVQADVNKFYTYNDFKNNLTQSIGGMGGPGGGSIIGIGLLMEARVNYLMGLSEFSAQAPVLGQPEPMVNSTSLTITATATSVEELWLAWRQMDGAPFELTAMADDGSHGDGTAGDGEYGATLEGLTGQVQYYLLGENSDAASFLPAMAAASFYEVSMAGTVVINEIMAKNDQTAPDQDGEYDDWIELWNNGSSAVSLSGWHLSDENDNATKWAFPDTVIEAGSTLIVWCDEDGSQSGLHASFKLSADGEACYLYNAEGELVDNVIFGDQDADLSYGRSPNGTGEFKSMEPSFSAANNSEATDVAEESAQPRAFTVSQNYPNPFNPSTTIAFSLPEAAETTVTIYNSRGQRIAVPLKEIISAGQHTVTWSAENRSSGVYFCVVSTPTNQRTLKMLLIK